MPSKLKKAAIAATVPGKKKKAGKAATVVGWAWTPAETGRISELISNLRKQGVEKPTAQMILEADRKIAGTLLQRFIGEPAKVYKKIFNVIRSETTGDSHKKRVIEAAIEAAETAGVPTSSTTMEFVCAEAQNTHEEDGGSRCDGCAFRDATNHALWVHNRKLQSEIVRLNDLIAASKNGGVSTSAAEEGEDFVAASSDPFQRVALEGRKKRSRTEPPLPATSTRRKKQTRTTNETEDDDDSDASSTELDEGFANATAPKKTQGRKAHGVALEGSKQRSRAEPSLPATSTRRKKQTRTTNETEDGDDSDASSTDSDEGANNTNLLPYGNNCVAPEPRTSLHAGTHVHLGVRTELSVLVLRTVLL